MHAFDLFLHIYYPLAFVRFDELPCVRRLYAAVIEQIDEPSQFISDRYAGWIPANLDALLLIAEYHNVEYINRMRVVEYMILEDQIDLFQRLIDHFANMVQDRRALMTTCNMVWKLTKLTTRQIQDEASRYARSRQLGNEYQVSEAALMALRNEKEKTKREAEKWRVAVKMVKKLAKMSRV